MPLLKVRSLLSNTPSYDDMSDHPSYEEAQNQRGPNSRSKGSVFPPQPPRFCSWTFLTCPDITELSLPNTMKMAFPNPDDLLNFTLTIEPDEGSSIITYDKY